MTAADYFDRLLEPVSLCLTREAAERLVRLRADPELQARIDHLAVKCNEGDPTGEEKSECETYVHAGNLIGTLQAKARRSLNAIAGA